MFGDSCICLQVSWKHQQRRYTWYWLLRTRHMTTVQSLQLHAKIGKTWLILWCNDDVVDTALNAVYNLRSLTPAFVPPALSVLCHDSRLATGSYDIISRRESTVDRRQGEKWSISQLSTGQAVPSRLGFARLVRCLINLLCIHFNF